MEYIDIKVLKRELSSSLKQYNGARDKVCEDKFAQFAITNDIKMKIRKSPEEMVGGRLVNTSLSK